VRSPVCRRLRGGGGHSRVACAGEADQPQRQAIKALILKLCLLSTKAVPTFIVFMSDGAGAVGGRLKAPPDRLQALSTGLEAFSRGARASAVQLLARPLREAAAASLAKILEVECPRRAWARDGHATLRRLEREPHGTDGTHEVRVAAGVSKVRQEGLRLGVCRLI
jgi:hypothetical protein